MSKLYYDGSVLSCTENELKLDGREVASSSMERRLLLFLMEHPDTAVSREELLREVWGYEMAGVTRTVDTHVKNLRAHLGELGPLIATVRGVGYRLDACANRACLCSCRAFS